MAAIKLYKINTHATLDKTLASQHLSIDSLSQVLPSGAYTTFRTYFKDRLFPMEVHYERLESSARLQGKKVILPRRLISETIKELIGTARGDQRLRLTLDLTHAIGMVYLSAEKLRTPPRVDYQRGVLAQSKQLLRENPKAKLTDFLGTAMQIRKQIDQSINEVIMVDESGRVKEGLSSNFFAVRDGAIYTADEDVLSGITRSIVLAEARHAGIEVRFTACKYAELADCEETFITSASRSVLPVRQIDDIVIGEGKPGPVTKLLSEKFWHYIALHTSAL